MNTCDTGTAGAGDLGYFYILGNDAFNAAVHFSVRRSTIFNSNSLIAPLSPPGAPILIQFPPAHRNMKKL